MAIGMPSTLKYYQSRTADMMFTNYQYVLKSCEDENGDAVTTQNPDAEAFCMTSLVRKSDVLDEEVSVYGIADGSRYVQINNLSGLEGNKSTSPRPMPTNTVWPSRHVHAGRNVREQAVHLHGRRHL